MKLEARPRDLISERELRLAQHLACAIGQSTQVCVAPSMALMPR
jgi:hypothetical protein